MSDELNEARDKEESNNLVSFISNNNPTDINQNNHVVKENIFKRRIDKLNRMFYIETEKCMDNKKPEDVNKLHNKLFLILFKQISLYSQEIERLKHIIRNQSERNKSNTNGYNSVTIIKPSEDHQKVINELRQSISKLEHKLHDKILNEEKKKIEMNSLKRQVIFYKEKLQIDLQNKKSEITLMKPLNNSNSHNHKYYSPKKQEEKSMALNQLLSCSPIIKKDLTKSNNNTATKVGSGTNVSASNKKIIKNKVSTIMTKNGSTNTLNLKSLVYKGTEIDETTKISIKEGNKKMSNSKSQEQRYFNEYNAILKYYNDEIKELTSIEVFLMKKRNELLIDKNKSITSCMSLDITTEMNYDNSLKTHGKVKRNEHFSLPKEKSRKKHFPMFTSIKIDL